MSVPNNSQSRRSTAHHLIAGTMGGLASTACLYPLELVKTRMQVIDDGTDVYRSFSKAFRTVLSKEGVKGFYSGVAPALIASAGSWGGYFYFYELSKERKLRARGTLLTVDHVRMICL